ncbi:hemolysin secretion protein D [Ochrobactrum sp. P6BS-III]|uniref:HlyD family type I secretion periplasmic adaptor subunit n=1 Tax=unclassified Ochrobactrum TaxID=239106 RepID=UPI000993949E|nr:HlyD family secretion protein [Ochrobactrum sp. P6BSIII]OOL20186.1 hemolysin secretion protein D [Ochrobactrum sp. P6BS-III]
MALVHLDVPLRVANAFKSYLAPVAQQLMLWRLASPPIRVHQRNTLPAPLTSRPRLRGVAWTGNMLVLTFLAGFGLWAMLAPLKSAAVAVGIVEAETSRKTIQHLEGGIVQQIYVHNGDLVSSGQVLIKLDDTKPRTELVGVQGQLWDAEASRARLVAEQGNETELVFPSELVRLVSKNPAVNAIVVGQRRIFEARRDVYQSEIAITHEKMEQVKQEITGLVAQKLALSSRVEITRQQLDMIDPLVKKGLERKTSLLNLAREKADLDGQFGETTAQISRAYQVINEAQANLIKLESDRQNEIAKELRDTENQLFLLNERYRAIDDQLNRTAIKAPETGIVMDLRIHTTGGVIGAGEPLLDLVPQNGNMVVSAHIRPEDIHLVHPGLNAQVHLLPYDQRRVPLLKGKVTYVSADRLLDKVTGQPFYAATIRVTDDELMQAGDIEMIPGMPVQALIETGESSVALYAVRPLLDSFHRAFREN